MCGLSGRLFRSLGARDVLRAIWRPWSGPIYLGMDPSAVPMRAPELQGRAGKQHDGSARTREAKLCTVWMRRETGRGWPAPARSELGHLHGSDRKRQPAWIPIVRFRTSPSGWSVKPSAAVLTKRPVKSS